MSPLLQPWEDGVEDAEQFLLRLGAEHGDARVAEVGQALEQGAGGQVAAHVEDTAAFVQQVDTVFHLLAEHVHAPFGGERGKLFARLQVMLHFLEYPRPSEAGTAYHDGVHAVALEALEGTLRGGDVAVADDGDVYARILLHLADEGPVGFARVHLRAGTAVDGQGADAAVLQLFGQGDDNLVLGIPAEAGLHGNGYLHRIDHGAGDLQHQRDVLEHARSGSLARHALHGTTEVDVEDVRACLFHNLGGFDHRGRVSPVYLDGYGAFFVADVQFLFRFADGAYQRVGRYEFGVHHVCTEAFAHQSESRVGNVLHRGEEYRAFAQVYVGYLHILLRFGCKSTEKRVLRCKKELSLCVIIILMGDWIWQQWDWRRRN